METLDSSDNHNSQNNSDSMPTCIAMEDLLIEKTKHKAMSAVTASTPTLAATSSAPRATSQSSNAICHAVYTSGSTGVPKCVLVQHRAMVAFVSAWRAAMRISRTSRVFMASAHTFDPSLSDMWTVSGRVAGYGLGVVHAQRYVRCVHARTNTHLHA